MGVRFEQPQFSLGISNTWFGNTMSITAFSQQPESKNNDVLPAFVDTVEELLLGLKEVFPECEKVKKKLRKFQAFIKSPAEVDQDGNVTRPAQLKPDGAKILLKDWHSQLGPHYEQCARRDVEAILKANPPIIEELDIAAKWADPTFDAESREILFQYIDTLNMYCQMQFIPSKMLSRIEGVAQQLAQQMETGNADLSKIDVFALGQQVLENVSEEELIDFANNLGEIQKMASVSSVHLNSNPELAQMMGINNPLSAAMGGGSGSLGGMMKMVGGLMKNLK